METTHEKPALPRRASDVNAEWLTQALRAAGLPVTVGEVRRGRMGEGVGMMSDLEKLEISYSEGEGPPVLIFKRPADNDANRAVADTFELYKREVLFYRDVAHRTPARTPLAYYADIDGNDFALIVEDLSQYQLGDQIIGCVNEEAAAVMRWMGRFHATFWDNVDDPTLEFLPLVHPSYSSEGLMQGAAFGWDPMVAAFGDAVPPHIAALKDRFLAALPTLFEWMAVGPMTVLHGDVRMDNLFFGKTPDQEPLIAVDWQGALRGRAAQDLGYFMSGSLPVETRRKHERELLQVWHDELCAAGVTGYTAEDAWQDYRRGTLFVWTHAVVISGTLDLANERGKAWVREMLVRSVAAFDDLDLIELLEEIESR